MFYQECHRSWTQPCMLPAYPTWPLLSYSVYDSLIMCLASALDNCSHELLMIGCAAKSALRVAEAHFLFIFISLLSFVCGCGSL